MAQKHLYEQHSRTFLSVTPAAAAKKLPQYLAAGLATLGALAVGTCLSWSSPAIPLLQQSSSHIQVTDEQGSWIGALITLGGFSGAIPAGILANRFGRKKLILLLSLPMFVSWIAIAYSPCVWGLYAARFLAGIAVGALSVATPMYVAELAESKLRGTLGTFFQLQITLGILIEYILGGIFDSFQLLALVSSTIPIIFLVFFYFMPESPVFLTSIGREDDAKKSLQWLRGSAYDIEDEMTQIKDDIKEAEKNKAKLSDLVKCKATSRALTISLGLMVFQQLSGVNAVFFYTNKIFSDAGSTIEPSVCAIMVGAVQVVATYLSTLLIDRAGRRILLTISASVMCLCLTSLGCYFHFKQNYDLSDYSVVPLASVALFIVVFSIGFGPIPWMMMGEIFPPKVKGLASSISASFNWMLAFSVTKLFQNMLEILGAGYTFGTFAIICALGTVFVLTMVPETKGKDMAEIQKMLLGGGDNCIKQIQYDSDEDIIKITVKK